MNPFSKVFHFHLLLSISLISRTNHITPKLEIRVVKAKRPNYNELKLNVDDCSKGNPERAGGGGVLRNHAGQMIMAFNDIKQIQSMSSRGHFSFIHTFREGNIIVYLLANMTKHCQTATLFTEAINLPSKIASTLKNDVVGQPNIRV
ncbi:hypothetical protein H5410_055236 [Solanum commersonii]|uniref:Uncharacterized protein n=1 Tax=Solanum commersonii TaxID=4109 RepID=A0A9J5WJR4_SOLCO|nr:hypothetical protein H5410_055236 [Solanum commersonii]